MHQSQHLIATSPLITINTIQSLILSNTSPQHSIESFIFTFTVSYTIFIFIFYKNIYFPHYSVMVNQTTKMFFSECQPWSTSMVLIYWDQMHTIHLNRYSDISFNNRGFGGGGLYWKSGTGVGARDAEMMQTVHGPNASQRNSQNSEEDSHLSLPQLQLHNLPGVTSTSDLKFCRYFPVTAV